MLEPVEQHLIELLRRMADSRGSPHDVLGDLGRQHGLKPRQRKRLRELHRVAVESRALVEEAMAAATPNGVAAPLRDAVRVMMVRVIAGDLSPRAAAARLPWVDWQRVATAREVAAEEPDPVARVVRVAGLPEHVARRLVAEWGAEADPLVRGLVGAAPMFLRANAALCTRDALQERLAGEGVTTSPCRCAQHGVQVEGSAQLFATGAFRDGWFEVQDEGSQRVAEVVDARSGQRVFDACAGAGGKTLAILSRAPGVELLACDVDAPRLADLRRRARRARLAEPRTLRVPPDRWPDEVEAFAREADWILLDVPCSGLGALRRDPTARDRLTERELTRLVATQRDLFARAVRCLRPGARLVYATCSVLREENEAAVAQVLASDSALTILPITGSSSPFLQLVPHRHRTDGFFAALLTRA